MVIHVWKLTASRYSFLLWHQTDYWVMQTFLIRLIPRFFPLKAAVILLSWGWHKFGMQNTGSKVLQSLLPGTDLYHDLIPPHGDCPVMSSWSANACNICWLLFIVCRTLIFSNCCTPGRSDGCLSTNTDKSVPSHNNGQSAPGMTVKGLKTGMLKVGMEQRDLVESLNMEWNMKQWSGTEGMIWCWTHILISTAATHTVLQKFPEMKSQKVWWGTLVRTYNVMHFTNTVCSSLEGNCQPNVHTYLYPSSAAVSCAEMTLQI